MACRICLEESGELISPCACDSGIDGNRRKQVPAGGIRLHGYRSWASLRVKRVVVNKILNGIALQYLMIDFLVLNNLHKPFCWLSSTSYEYLYISK